MPTNYSRDTPTQPLLPSHHCSPISSSFRFCAGDVTALVVAAVSIWYIVWGIPLTIRCYKFLSAKFTAYRSRQAGLPEDVEKDDEAEDKEIHTDPSLSPASDLRTRLTACEDLIRPPPVYSSTGNLDSMEVNRSTSAAQLPSQSLPGVTPKLLSRTLLSGIYSPPSMHPEDDSLVPAAEVKEPLKPSANANTSTTPDIASVLPSCPPLAHLADAGTERGTAACKPCMW